MRCRVHPCLEFSYLIPLPHSASFSLLCVHSPSFPTSSATPGQSSHSAWTTLTTGRFPPVRGRRCCSIRYARNSRIRPGPLLRLSTSVRHSFLPPATLPHVLPPRFPRSLLRVSTQPLYPVEGRCFLSGFYFLKYSFYFCNFQLFDPGFHANLDPKSLKNGILPLHSLASCITPISNSEANSARVRLGWKKAAPLECLLMEKSSNWSTPRDGHDAADDFRVRRDAAEDEREVHTPKPQRPSLAASPTLNSAWIRYEPTILALRHQLESCGAPVSSLGAVASVPHQAAPSSSQGLWGGYQNGMYEL